MINLTYITPAEARKQGFKIDHTTYPWLAYKGERFRPTESTQCYTALEASLQEQVEKITDETIELRDQGNLYRALAAVIFGAAVILASSLLIVLCQ